jgi:hypothetical protein
VVVGNLVLARLVALVVRGDGVVLATSSSYSSPLSLTAGDCVGFGVVFKFSADFCFVGGAR